MIIKTILSHSGGDCSVSTIRLLCIIPSISPTNCWFDPKKSWIIDAPVSSCSFSTESGCGASELFGGMSTFGFGGFCGACCNGCCWCCWCWCCCCCCFPCCCVLLFGTFFGGGAHLGTLCLCGGCVMCGVMWMLIFRWECDDVDVNMRKKKVMVNEWIKGRGRK